MPPGNDSTVSFSVASRYVCPALSDGGVIPQSDRSGGTFYQGGSVALANGCSL